MRTLFRKVFSFFWHSETSEPVLEVVANYRESYSRIDQLLETMPEVLQLIHVDFQSLSQGSSKERETDFTTENLFRALLVMQCEGLSFRETTLRIAESETLQHFCRLVKKKTIDHTLLCRAFHAIRPETWETVNQLLGIRMKHQGSIEIDHIRTDTTVTESNIHYPTDSSLRWDTYRVLERYIEKLRQLLKL